MLFRSEGVFELSKFNYLTTDQLYFIEVFMKNRGSIKQIEKELDVSYPTVKKMLDDVIVGLGYNIDQEEVVNLEPKTKVEDIKSKILEDVQNGILTINEAFSKLTNKGE